MRHSPVRKLARLLPVTLLASLLFAAGCTPTCGQSCRKLLFRCGDLEYDELTLEECEESCNRQESLYQLQENDELLALVRDHRRCLATSSCEEIANDVCYDGFEVLYPFDSTAR